MYVKRRRSKAVVKLFSVSEIFKVITVKTRKVLQMEVQVWFNGVLCLLTLIVVVTDGYTKSLLGRTLLNALQPDWSETVYCVKHQTINDAISRREKSFWT